MFHNAFATLLPFLHFALRNNHLGEASVTSLPPPPTPFVISINRCSNIEPGEHDCYGIGALVQPDFVLAHFGAIEMDIYNPDKLKAKMKLFFLGANNTKQMRSLKQYYKHPCYKWVLLEVAPIPITKYSAHMKLPNEDLSTYASLQRVTVDGNDLDAKHVTDVFSNSDPSECNRNHSSVLSGDEMETLSCLDLSNKYFVAQDALLVSNTYKDPIIQGVQATTYGHRGTLMRVFPALDWIKKTMKTKSEVTVPCQGAVSIPTEKLMRRVYKEPNRKRGEPDEPKYLSASKRNAEKTGLVVVAVMGLVFRLCFL